MVPRFAAFSILCLICLPAWGLAADEPVATVDFAKDVRPILIENCVVCHGPETQEGGLRLDRKVEALEGGDRGPAILAGNSAESRLIRFVSGLDEQIRMPPKESGDPLTEAQIATLKAWIDAGAVWPDEADLAGGSQTESDHWAFQPPVRQTPPAVGDPRLVRNPIDAFIVARLESQGIAPSPEADRATLIRRLSFDLLGLPPTPEQVAQFLADDGPGAYERLVERLLDSPHYGERWGRHWLDMARYADSDGFEKDNGRPHAWRYRQWVIEALNRDLPFDQFTIEQLAGDLLSDATLEQRVATGFHRNTLTNTEGGVDAEQFRVEQVVDRVNTTAKVFLGITLGCAQCHNHKYDPFSQREYYRFFAYFNSDVETNIVAPLAVEVEPYNQAKAAFDQKLAELETAAAAYKRDQLAGKQQAWEAELKLPAIRTLPANIAAILLVEPATRNEQQTGELAAHYETLDVEMVALNKAVADHKAAAPAVSQAQTLALGSPRATHVMIRGDFLRPGVEVAPSTPRALASGGSAPSTSRLDLARWIVEPNNPLTARVAVNWVWQRYFGRGIVVTLEDFGTQGERPSHPELLDWLATEMMRQGWSLKSLHRTIVTSATYRQSSASWPELSERDPLNILLARQNRLRLDAEVIRDNALAASGLLVRRVGGSSVRPPQPAGISELTYADSARWEESAGADRYRRGLYTWFQRTSPYPMLMTFDAPDSNVCSVRRERSNTPLQALTLLNDTVFVEAARSLGLRLAALPATSSDDRIRAAFQSCLARDPSPGELATLGVLHADLAAACASQPDAAAALVGPEQPPSGDVAATAAWVAIARTIMNLDEFVTRE